MPLPPGEVMPPLKPPVIRPEESPVFAKFARGAETATATHRDKELTKKAKKKPEVEAESNRTLAEGAKKMRSDRNLDTRSEELRKKQRELDQLKLEHPESGSVAADQERLDDKVAEYQLELEEVESVAEASNVRLTVAGANKKIPALVSYRTHLITRLSEVQKTMTPGEYSREAEALMTEIGRVNTLVEDLDGMIQINQKERGRFKQKARSILDKVMKKQGDTVWASTDIESFGEEVLGNVINKERGAPWTLQTAQALDVAAESDPKQIRVITCNALKEERDATYNAEALKKKKEVEAAAAAAAKNADSKTATKDTTKDGKIDDKPASADEEAKWKAYKAHFGKEALDKIMAVEAGFLDLPDAEIITKMNWGDPTNPDLLRAIRAAKELSLEGDAKSFAEKLMKRGVDARVFFGGAAMLGMAAMGGTVKDDES